MNQIHYKQNRYLNHLVDSCFQEINRLFVLSFENDSHQNLQAIFSSDCRNKRLQCYH